MFHRAWCILIAAGLVVCGDRGTGPSSEARIVLDVRYRPAGGAAKVGAVQRVSRMVATVYRDTTAAWFHALLGGKLDCGGGTFGKEVLRQDLRYEEGIWRAALKVPAGTYTSYLVLLEGFKGEYVRWRGCNSVLVQFEGDYPVVIELASTNRAPVLAAIGDQQAAEESTLRIELSATDADEDELTYGVFGHPAGSSLSESTFTWTPTHEQAGAYEVTLTVSDGRGGTDSETITITVEESGQEDLGDAQVVGEIEEAAGDAEVVGEIEEDSGDAEIVGEVEE